MKGSNVDESRPDDLRNEESSRDEARRPPWRLAIGLGLLAIASSIWLFLKPPEVSDSGLDFEPTAEQSLQIEQLRAQISKKNPKFRDSDAREKENAKLFTYMAATSNDPLVIEAALTAIQASFSSRSEKKETPDEDLDRILLRYMTSPSARIADLAFQAARIPIMTEAPRPELISDLAAMVESDESLARRYRALETLNLLRPTLRSETVRNAFEKALESHEPLLISLSLFALAESGPSLTKANPSELITLGQSALRQTKNANPGVRGRALALLTELPSLVDEKTLIATALAALADKDGYVRGQALDTLSRSSDPAIIPKLLPLTRDLTRARYDISNWTDLSGEPGLLPHDIPGRKTVAEAALFALRSVRGNAIAAGNFPKEPELTISLGPAQSDAAILETARLVEAWAEKIPTLSPSAPAQHKRESPTEPSPASDPKE